MRRRLTHFLFEVRGVTRGTSTLRSFSFSSFPFPVFLIILRFALPFIQFFLTRVIKLFRYIYIYIYITTCTYGYVHFLLLAPKGRSSTKLHLSAEGTAGNTIFPILRNIPDVRVHSLFSELSWMKHRFRLPFDVVAHTQWFCTRCNHGANLQSKEERVQHRSDIGTRQGWR